MRDPKKALHQKLNARKASLSNYKAHLEQELKETKQELKQINKTIENLSVEDRADMFEEGKE